MDTGGNYFAFSKNDIDKINKPEMKEEYERDKAESEDLNLHPIFQVDGKSFTPMVYAARTPLKLSVKRIN
jgi:hypothetical protein